MQRGRAAVATDESSEGKAAEAEQPFSRHNLTITLHSSPRFLCTRTLVLLVRRHSKVSGSSDTRQSEQLPAISRATRRF